MVRLSIARTRSRIFSSEGRPNGRHLEQLPGYAPDLNPDEGIWNYLKRVELGNVCCANLDQLHQALIRATERLRQIIETVNDKLLNTFRLARERPHDLTGFQARLAAKVALHNFCLWLNLHLGRAPLAFAELLEW